jgi:hypothetical protein
MANNPARSALDAALVREEHAAVFLRGVTVRRARINALLAFAMKTNVAIDDPNVGARSIDVVSIQTELLLDRGGIENRRAEFGRRGHAFPR